MYQGKVLLTFVDKHNPRKGAYKVGQAFESRDLDRMKELADGGYIEFVEPSEPDPPQAPAEGPKQKAKGKIAKE